MASDRESSVQSLLRTVTKLRGDSFLTSSETAPNFNLFRVLGVESSEVSTHSAFLGHLLTPGESHAQGHLFLQHFLETIVQIKAVAGLHDWTVTRELTIKGGRLDIVLRSPQAKTIIVVENKIDTQDGTGQLDKYRDWLDAPRRKKAYETRLLLYLTPNDASAKHAHSSKYRAISYSNQIAGWLSSCLEQVKPHGLKDAIKAYLSTISTMNTKAFTKDDLDEKILGFINEPANQASKVAALRIGRIAKFLREDTLRHFWKSGEAYLKKKCAESGYKDWSLHPYGDDVYQANRGITMNVNGAEEERPHPTFVFNQFVNPTLFRWEWGVKFDAWLGKNDKIRVLPEAVKLTSIMDETLHMPRKRGWDGYALYTDDAKGMDRTLEDELSKQTDVSEFFEGGWKTFQQLEPHLKKLNSAVLQHIK